MQWEAYLRMNSPPVIAAGDIHEWLLLLSHMRYIDQEQKGRHELILTCSCALHVCLHMSKNTLCRCGCKYAQALTQKELVAKKKAAMSSDIAKALARLSSGLYVVTADSKGAKGAMVGLPAVMRVSPYAYLLVGVLLGVMDLASPASLRRTCKQYLGTSKVDQLV